MIKMLDKISRKHYIQCGLALVLTGVILWFCTALRGNGEITVSFISQYPRNIEYRIYYTQNTEENFGAEQYVAVDVKKGTQKTVVKLPVDKLVKFRLNIKSNPGKVILSDIKLQGAASVKLDGKMFNQHQINKYKTKNGKIIIISTREDPYLVYKKELNLKAKMSIDKYRLIIFSILLFLLMYKFIQYLSKFKLEKRHSRIDIVMIAVFFGLLFVPMSHISNIQRSEQEKRMLAPKPQLTFDEDEEEENYGTQFEAWYNDHFFGREAMIGLYNNIKYFISPTVGNDRILVGKDGWLFLKSDNGFNNYANTAVLSDKNMKNGLMYLQAINDWCKKHGKKFYYIIVPDKDKIYGEYYRLIRKQRPDEYGIAEQFVNYIRENSDVNVIYLRDVLLKHKDEGLLYYKGDTHWSNLGAYHGYGAIAKNISHDFPIKIMKINKRKKQSKSTSDLYNMFGIKTKEEYSIPDYTRKAVCEEKGKFKREKDGLVTCKNKDNKYNVFVLRDSFFSWLIPYVSDTFKDTKILWKQNMATEDLKDIEENYDIVIVENVERYIPQILKRKFPALPKKEK